MKQGVFARVIGVDVAKRQLDIADSDNRLTKQVPNTINAIRTQIAAKLKDGHETVVVCESSGGYEQTLVDALHEAEIAVAVVNPRQIRDFAKGLGYLEKNDPIDATVIRRFGEVAELHLAEKKSDELKQQQALTRRRRQLQQTINQEENRLGQILDPVVRELIQETLKHLKRQLADIDQRLLQMVTQEAKSNATIEILLSTPGVGVITTATLLCELPELGRLNRGAIAKMVGVAPLVDQSGTSDRKRRTCAGRSHVRKALYMATLTATRHNEQIREFYQRLLRRGKPKKLALVAAMRKLLTILNEMVRRGECWASREKTADCSQPSL